MQHHGADSNGEFDTGLRTLRSGHDDVRWPYAFLEGFGDIDLGVLGRVRVLRIVGHDHFGHQDAARSGHESGGEEVRQVARTE